MVHFPFSRVWSARAYQGKKRKLNHPSLIRSLPIPPAASMMAGGGQSGDGQVVAARRFANARPPHPTPRPEKKKTLSDNFYHLLFEVFAPRMLFLRFFRFRDPHFLTTLRSGSSHRQTENMTPSADLTRGPFVPFSLLWL